MRYANPIDYRRKAADRMRRRYWRDKEHRPDKINAVRARQGRPPHASLDDVAHRGPISGV